MTYTNKTYKAGQLLDGHYKLLKLLSNAGGSADVWLAIDTNTVEESTDEDQATKVAIKIYRPKNIIDVEGEYQFRNEFKRVFGCHHENIIQPTYFNIYEGMPYLVMPYCPAGSSERLVGRLTDKTGLWKYIYEVASGLAYLHEHLPQIIHQDIKPANVLVDDNGNYAITDFGISAEMCKDELVADNSGTFAYMAPERFGDGTQPMPQSDIWAFGAAIYELITGDTPFGNDGGAKQGKHTPIPPITQAVPDDIKRLVEKCLAYDASVRPTARNIVDLVLKKRYSRNKRAIAIVTAVIIAVTAFVTLFVMKNVTDYESQFVALCARPDSIVAQQFGKIGTRGYTPTMENVDQLSKAIVLYNNACAETKHDFPAKDSVAHKVAMLERINDMIEKYVRNSDLADKALLTEMEDMYIEHKIKTEMYRDSVNQLILQIK